MRATLLFTVLLVGVIGVAYGLDCYGCYYDEQKQDSGDKLCLDDPEKAPVRPCGNATSDDGILHCAKQLTTKEDGKKSVGRFCKELTENTDKCTMNGEEETCYCSGDKCNGVGSRTISVVALVPLLTSVLLFNVYSN